MPKKDKTLDTSIPTWIQGAVFEESRDMTADHFRREERDIVEEETVTIVDPKAHGEDNLRPLSVVLNVDKKSVA